MKEELLIEVKAAQPQNLLDSFMLSMVVAVPELSVEVKDNRFSCSISWKPFATAASLGTS